ncbi:TetR/AcrR family transcriptional regulator [Lactococcus lactis]|uniref:TetR/AcrR family transcriptional regulator n=1 Tax=Lactococcus lactis TaxID=1358 RepID=UPI002892737D|nr:TetR/AcrR family transcriptional regulator [Lactococcus lactis]MDT2874292.1 TetR/AcrR family transcriptional regulator [Lactococcus lactis]MDT2936362.1 TetR/AcrR family transcriptional regulator [Lactococcus lactis]
MITINKGTKEKILINSESLFRVKGYEKTTIENILEKTKIGKGTFYYYFKSKEALMNEVIERFIKSFTENAKEIVDNNSLCALEKFRFLILGQSNSMDNKEWMLEELHKPENSKMHQKSITETILHLTPLLTEIVEQGIKEKTFSTIYPKETVEILLFANQYIFDTGIITFSIEEYRQKAKAFVYSMEMLLGVKPGTFEYVFDHFEVTLLQRREGE